MGQRIFSRFLSSDGTTSGTKNMATTADEYYIRDANNTLAIERMIVSYEDSGGGTVAEYGNIGAALATGILVQTKRRDGTTVLNNLTDDVPITVNGDWARFCYDYQQIGHGSGNDIFAVRWTFSKAGEPIILEPGQRLSMVIQDSLALLDNHYALVQGVIL